METATQTSTQTTVQTALKLTTKVLPGNKIEVQLPPGSEGHEVEVIVVLPQEKDLQPEGDRPNVLEIIEEARQHRVGMSAEEIDQYLKEERDSWDA